MNELKDKLVDAILKGTTYSGNKLAGVKNISASQLYQDDLVLWLKYKYGYDDANKIELNTLGTLAHAGLEQIFGDLDNYSVESKHSRMLEDWSVTGSIDLIDLSTKSIVDWKVSDYKVIMEKIKKEGKDSAYSLQMGFYKYLLDDHEYKAYLGVLNRKQSYYTKDGERNVFAMHEVETHSITVMEELILEKINRLKKYIETDTTPPQCDYLGWSRAYAKAKPIRCIKYCNVSSKCPHNGFKKNNEKLKMLLGI